MIDHTKSSLSGDRLKQEDMDMDLRAKPFYLNDEQIAWVEQTRDSMG